MRFEWLRRAAAALLAAAFAGGVAGAPAPKPRPLAPRGELVKEERATIELFRRASPSVVYITTLNRVMNPWTRDVSAVPAGTGSGFVWDERGHIVTNFHVIADAQGAQVRLADQRAFPATLVGVSPEHDLAVLRIDVPDKPPAPLPLGSSGDLLVGQRVFAIGNPFGLDHTLTTGIISALERSMGNQQGTVMRDLIQTDAAINPGNSGGPLLDSSGRLIGVNTAIYSPSGASAGIGFAVPADTVNHVVPEIIAYGRYERPSLGITVDERISALVTARLGVKGLLILDVEPGSGAALAGLRGSDLGADGSIVPGDIIQRIDGQAIASLAELKQAMESRRMGERLRLRLWRAGKFVELVVVLERRRRV